jgi:peroxiredoxin
MPMLENEWRVLKDKNVEIIGVNVGEDALTVKNFVGQFGVDFPILLDKEKLATKKYAIGPMPTTYFINADGKITDIYVGMLDKDTFDKQLEQLN